MTPEDFERRSRAVAEAGKVAAEHAIVAKVAALMAVQVQTLSMLEQKGLIDANDINGVMVKMEVSSAAMAQVSPEIGKELADLALQLRHALFKSNTKSN